MIFFLCFFRNSISTTFYPTFARKVFPCFDEPQYKTPFRLIVQHQKSFNAVSNMDRISLVKVSISNNKFLILRIVIHDDSLFNYQGINCRQCYQWEYTGSVKVEFSPPERKVVSSSHSRVIPKTWKMVIDILSWAKLESDIDKPERWLPSGRMLCERLLCPNGELNALGPPKQDPHW